MHRDDGGLTRRRPTVHADNGPDDILSVRTTLIIAPTPSPRRQGATLDAGATYWVVFATESGPYLNP